MGLGLEVYWESISTCLPEGFGNDASCSTVYLQLTVGLTMEVDDPAVREVEGKDEDEVEWGSDNLARNTS